MEAILKKYLCKTCGDNNFENFYEGRYSSCKKCRNKTRITTNAIKKFESIDPKTLNDTYNNFLFNDRTNFDGYSLFQIINEMREEIELLKSRIIILESEDDKNKKEITKLRKFLTEKDLLNEKKLNDD